MQAEFYLQRLQLIEAAASFAKTTRRSFEDVVLILLGQAPCVLSMSAENSETWSRHAHGSAAHAQTLLFDLHAHPKAKECFNDLVSFHALRVYMEELLKSLPVALKSQRTMIATWACEIYLHLLQLTSQSKSPSTQGTPLPTQQELLGRFKDFLRSHRYVPWIRLVSAP